MIFRIFAALTLVPLFCPTASNAEFLETLPDGTRPPAAWGETGWETNFVGAAQQPTGALSGRLIFTCGGHGWTWREKGWYTQRGVSNEMNEDYGNLEQMNAFVPYAFNSGATVITFRPVGYQTNEVVMDNESRGVTFAGEWFRSTSDVYFGNSDSVPYRFSVLAKTETATATYTPKIPVAGFYPVYTWVRHGGDRTLQLYRIQHTGGQSLMRIPHHMVGNGWVYLGTYHFKAGSNRDKGSVVISNLQPSPGFGSVAVADAIRFGNGMGDVVPAEGATISGYPREEEAARYWIQRSFGQGQTNFLSRSSSDHQGGNVGAPIRMAREMNRESESDMFKRIYLGFHSNAGGGRGVVALWNNPQLFPGTKTPNQERYAEILGREVNDTFAQMSSPPLEVPWFHRTRVTYARNDYAFGELNDRYIEGEFDATILEVAFHDSAEDAKLMRDPKVRDIAARASYQSILHYMNEFDGVSLSVLPEPPRNIRAAGSNHEIVVSWDEPPDADKNPVEHYLLYRSENGYGFGQPIRVPAKDRSVMVPAQPKTTYFRVTAVNAGGESLPSGVAGCAVATNGRQPRILFINGFTQVDRANNPRQTIEATNYIPPGPFGKMERVIPRLNNSFDYVVQHGEALARTRNAFDSCQRDAIANGAVQLGEYDVVIWAAGRQRTNLFDSSEQRLLNDYLANGGHLFVSGAHLAENVAALLVNNRKPFDFLCHDCPNPAVTAFTASVAPRSIFRRNKSLEFGKGNDEMYFLATVNALSAGRDAAVEALFYDEEAGAAAVSFDGTKDGRGKVVCFGFPFETIASPQSRAEYLSDILGFFRASTRQPLTGGE